MNRQAKISHDIYRLLDEAGLNAGTLSNAKMPLHQIVNQIRTELAVKITDYIENMPKRIEVDFKDE